MLFFYFFLPLNKLVLNYINLFNLFYTYFKLIIKLNFFNKYLFMNIMKILNVKDYFQGYLYNLIFNFLKLLIMQFHTIFL